MNSLEKWIFLTPLQKLPNNEGDLGKIIVATSFEWLPKVQKIAKSGHTVGGLKSLNPSRSYLSPALCTFTLVFYLVHRITYAQVGSNIPYHSFSWTHLKCRNVQTNKLPNGPIVYKSWVVKLLIVTCFGAMYLCTINERQLALSRSTSRFLPKWPTLKRLGGRRFEHWRICTCR